MKILCKKFWLGLLISGIFSIVLPFNSIVGETKEKLSDTKLLFYSQNEIVVQFTDRVKIDLSEKYPYPSGFQKLDSLNAYFQTKKIVPFLINNNQRFEQIFPHLARTYLFQFSKNADVDEIIESYSRLNIVSYVEPNYFYFSSILPAPEISGNDLTKLQAAISLIYPQKSITIAVVGDGINRLDEDLNNSLWENENEKIDHQDNDFNGIVDDLLGCNFAQPDSIIPISDFSNFDKTGSGTGLVETINRIVNNIVPLHPSRPIINKIMALKAGELSNNKIQITAFSASRAILYAAEQKADLINLPWGGYFHSELLESIITFGNSQGCAIIACAGDENSSAPFYPAAFENVLAVGAINPMDEKTTLSNFGEWIDVVAPGFIINDYLVPDSVQTKISGTTLASAYVTGLAGLLCSHEGKMAADSLLKRIIFSSENIYQKNETFLGNLGAGRINILRAINEQQKPNIFFQRIEYLTDNLNNQLFPGDDVSVVLKLKNLSVAAENVNITMSSLTPYINLIENESNIAVLKYNEEFKNDNAPFRFHISENLPGDEAPLLKVMIKSEDGFELSKELAVPIGLLPPKNLSIINTNPIALQWNPSRKYVGYMVYRKSANDKRFIQITSSTIASTTFEDNTAMPGKQYLYYVTGIDSFYNESESSVTVSAQAALTPKFEFFPADSVVFMTDSLQLAVSIENDSRLTFSFIWLVNGIKIKNTNSSSMMHFPNFTKNNLDTIQLTVKCEELDSTIKHHWIVNKNSSIISSQISINSFIPTTDTTISADDSLHFFIELDSTNQASMSFSWFLNDSLLANEKNSSFSWLALASLPEFDSIKVVISTSDTSISVVWNIQILPKQFLNIEKITFIPKSDTTISEGDSLLFNVGLPAVIDSLPDFLWHAPNQLGSTSHDSIYFYRADYLSSRIDTIRVAFILNDSLFQHQWVINVLNRNRVPEILSRTVPVDTLLSGKDSIYFSVSAFDPDGDSLFYQWFVNGEIDTSAIDTFYCFSPDLNIKIIDSLICNISDFDTSIVMRWAIHYADSNNSLPEIVNFYPDPDSQLSKYDSLDFKIQCFDKDGDSLTYSWYLNELPILFAKNSIYSYSGKSSATKGNDTLKVVIADADTFVVLKWLLWAEFSQTSSLSELPISFSPKNDSLRAEGDSIKFAVENCTDTTVFSWRIDGHVDSTAQQSIFTYFVKPASDLVDTVRVEFLQQDSLVTFCWLVYYPITTIRQDSIFISFYPSLDSLYCLASDSIKLSVQILSNENSDFSCFWFVNNILDQSSEDTIFYYRPQPFFLGVDTISVLVSKADTNLFHHWLVKSQLRQYLPPPKLVFPNAGNRITEFDKLMWQDDSTGVASDSVAEQKYFVELSRDSTFLEIMSADTCFNTEIRLEDLSGFNNLRAGNGYFWRVKLILNQIQFSDFAVSRKPFFYYAAFCVIDNYYGERTSEGILLQWSTSYEGNCLGFNIYRSENQNGSFEKINDHLIQGQNNYSFFDKFQEAGKSYFYKLEEITRDNRQKFLPIINIERKIPDQYSLSQNYPNPFNGKTSFKYQIPVTTHISIEVFNILGKKVITLIDQRQEAGYYTIYWDGFDNKGEHVGSGIYFYQMHADQFHNTNKMIVVR